MFICIKQRTTSMFSLFYLSVRLYEKHVFLIFNKNNINFQAIIDASVLPLSIIIVGVGEADFSAMNELDADTVPLIMNGRQAARDIVQFVPLRHFQGRNVPVHLIKARLAKEVLAEVPDQLVGFMKSQGIKPKGMAAQ